MNFEKQKQEIEDWKQSAINYIEDLSMCDDWLIIDTIKNKSHILLNMIKKMRLQDLKPDYPTCSTCKYRVFDTKTKFTIMGKPYLASEEYCQRGYNDKITYNYITGCIHHSQLESKNEIN